MRAFRFALVMALLLAPWPVLGKNKNQVIMALAEVAVSAPVSATITNGRHQTGYLVVKTENETATASLVVTVLNKTVLGNFLVCTSSAITTDTTTVILLGSTVAAADGVTDACDFPMGVEITYTFTVTGAGADFDVTANMSWAD